MKSKTPLLILRHPSAIIEAEEFHSLGASVLYPAKPPFRLLHVDTTEVSRLPPMIMRDWFGEFVLNRGIDWFEANANETARPSISP